MPMYELEITKSVEKDLRKIAQKMHPAFFDAIESLTSNPFPKSNYKKLKGTVNSYRLRVGNYRIIYEVDSSVNKIVVYRIRDRKNSYKNL